MVNDARGDPARLAAMPAVNEGLAAAAAALQAEGKIGALACFPYTPGFAAPAVASGIFAGVIAYCSLVETELDIDLASRHLVIGGVDSDKAVGPNDSPLIASFAIDPETGALSERGRVHCGDGLYWVEIVDLP